MPSSKFGDCYPSQFIQGYTSIVNASSSIAPMFSPLVCPSGWSTAREWDNGYIACCASGFAFHPPDTTADANRPGYGGTCYSNFIDGNTVNLTVYDSASITATAAWVVSTNTDQAYAHPIDGFKLDSVSSSSGQLSGGAIAGITIGAVAGLFIIVLLFWLHRRKRKAAALQQAQSHDASAAHNAIMSPVETSVYGGSTVISPQSEQKELPLSPADQSWATTPASHEYNVTTNITSPDGHTPRYELDGPSLGEMDGGWRGNEMRG